MEEVDLATSVWLDGTTISEETYHLLAAAGRVEGDAENGYRWTREGAEWFRSHLARVARGYWSE